MKTSSADPVLLQTASGSGIALTFGKRCDKTGSRISGGRKEAEMISLKSKCFIFVFLLCIFLCGASFCEDEVPSGFWQAGILKKTAEAVPVYSQPGRNSEIIGRMNPEDIGMILGEQNQFYQILLPEGSGYVQKSKLRCETRKAESPFPEALCSSVSLQKTVPSRLDTHLVLQGSLSADMPFQTLFFYLWDERQFRIELAQMVSLREPADSISLDAYPRILPLKNLEGGRKTLIIEGVSGDRLFILFRSQVYIRGRSRELPHVTDLCEGLPRQLLDQDVKTVWTPKEAKPSLVFTVPENAGAVILALEWSVIPERCMITYQDADDHLIASEVISHGFYADCLDLDPAVRKITVAPEGEKAALSSVRLYAEPYSRHVIQRWLQLPEKLDLLVISTHQDDEFLFLGGTIPLYAARPDVSMGVLYMANCGRLRYREALDALWSAGLRTHPLFLNLPDSDSHDIRKAQSLWNRFHPLDMLIEIIRRYRPEVIVTQDFRGEYGNGEHKLTASLAAEAVKLAAEETVEPASAKQYGSWQVKKLYIHLYPENQIRMDWNQPLDESGIITPLFLAKEGFDRHHSQTVLFNMEYDGTAYDNALFGLYYSAVGEDILKNDFLENIRLDHPEETVMNQ